MRYIYYINNLQGETQRNGIKEYLLSRSVYPGDCTSLLCDFGIDSPNYDIGVRNMLAELSKGDIVYVWDLAVLAKRLDSLYSLLLYTSQTGITIIQCQDGEVIGSESAESLSFIKGIGVASRIVFETKSKISKRGIEERKRKIEEQGGYLNKRGEWKTHLGRDKGSENREAVAAAVASVKRKRKEWLQNSVGYNWVIEQLKAGLSRKEIVREFNKRHETNPEDYSTREGRPLSKGVLCRWIQKM